MKGSTNELNTSFLVQYALLHANYQICTQAPNLLTNTYMYTNVERCPEIKCFCFDLFSKYKLTENATRYTVKVLGTVKTRTMETDSKKH